MWLVNLALRRPYTVWVGLLLLAVLGTMSYRRTPTDILPNIKMPVVVVFASYRGMPAPDMEQTVTAVLERALTKCDHLEHIESRSLLGIGIIKVYFRPVVDADLASSQVVSLVSSELQNLPPGMLPPTIMKYDATAVPVGDLVISSETRDDRYLLDLADHQLRDELAGLEGLTSAPVFGGVFRQVQIYVHPRTLEAMKMSHMDVARVVNNQSQVIPTGEMRIDKQDYYVSSNSMVETPEDFAKLPILVDGRKVVYLGDIAEIKDDQRWRTNIVHVDGRRAVSMPLLRQAGASAVHVVDNVQAFLPKLRDRGVVPDDVEVSLVFDQAQYVRDALSNLFVEGILGAVLASLVVLLFLGSLRSTAIVALSIPASVAFGFVGLYYAGETLNIMTLGGLALVLGRIVDDSIVDVENTVRHLHMGKSPFQAALDSAREIAVPVLMATVTTVIVFFPLTMLTGVGKYLFTPLAVSATLAMFASYIVSRTVSPVCCARWLRAEPTPAPSASAGIVPAEALRAGVRARRFPLSLVIFGSVFGVLGLVAWLSARFFPLTGERLGWEPQFVVIAYRGLFVSGVLGGLLLIAAFLFGASHRFDRLFEGFTHGYVGALEFCLRRKLAVGLLLAACITPAVLAFRHTGEELFPEVDSSEFTVHVRANGGPRVEETERQVELIETMISRGHKVDFRRMRDEVFRADEADDRAYLDAVLDANEGAAGETVRDVLVASRLSDLQEQRTALDQLEKQQNGRRFFMPPIIPPEDQELVLANVGLSSRWGAIYTTNNGPHAAFLRVQLRSGFDGRTTSTTAYVERLRRKLEYYWPTYDFFFETGGMIRRILNAGAIAPVELQVYGRDHDARRAVSRILNKELLKLPSVEDTYLPQGMDLPLLLVKVDRARAARPGLTQSDVIRNVIGALMSTAQLAPNFWIDPTSGNPYVIGVQYPEYIVDGVATLETIPITGTSLPRHTPEGASPSRADPAGKGTPLVRLKDVARVERSQGPIEVFHYKSSPVSQVFVSTTGHELSRINHDVQHAVEHLPLAYALWKLPESKQHLTEDPRFISNLEEYVAGRRRGLLGRVFVSKRTDPGSKKLGEEIKTRYGVDPATLRIPQGVRVEMRGEASLMVESFEQMGLALVLAVLLVYLIMAAQFQSWLDPLVMIVAAPLGLIGVAAVLWLTGSTLNVQSLMGVLMMVGISVSNSVLLVEFANEQRRQGQETRTAIVEAARVRLRPILMTSIATVFGLLPMAIHLHPGDEMNLPLARAVIGGIASSTLLTLFIVPVLYVLLKPRGPQGDKVTG
jgi:multidrug efflux pump subunit AcrB